MKFKTRLLVTFLTIVLLPLLLTMIAFMSIGGYLMNAQKEFGLVNMDWLLFCLVFLFPPGGGGFASLAFGAGCSFPLGGFGFASLAFGAGLIEDKASYIIVRKGDSIYYTGNEEAAWKIFFHLPAYGYANAGIYFSSLYSVHLPVQIPPAVSIASASGW